MAVDGGNTRVAHHLDDGEHVTRIAPALRDVRRAGVTEVEELCFLAGQLVPEDIGGDREQALPLLADVDVRPARFAGSDGSDRRRSPGESRAGIRLARARAARMFHENGTQVTQVGVCSARKIADASDE